MRPHGANDLLLFPHGLARQHLAAPGRYVPRRYNVERLVTAENRDPSVGDRPHARTAEMDQKEKVYGGKHCERLVVPHGPSVPTIPQHKGTAIPPVSTMHRAVPYAMSVMGPYGPSGLSSASQSVGTSVPGIARQADSTTDRFSTGHRIASA
eukprot:2154229-Rhodomonas_salina.1